MPGECYEAVVCDNGTGLVKCGMAGDVYPRAVFPCIIGRPVVRREGLIDTKAVRELLVGEACLLNKAHVEISYSIRNAIVQDWEGMDLIWDHAFHHQLHIHPSDCRVLLTDPALNPLENRRRMLEVMFEKYGFQGAMMQNQAVLTLYAQGLLTGLVLDSGDGVSHMVPVVEGYAYSHLAKRLNVAGRHITQYLVELLVRRGYPFRSTSDFDDVQGIKEKVCYVAVDYAREMKLARETTVLTETYQLPDGRIIKVAAERFMAPEALFNPYLVDVEAPGLAETTFNCIQGVDVDNRPALYHHIVVSGGSTMFPGLPTRLEHELRSLYRNKVLKDNLHAHRLSRCKVHDPPNRQHMVFRGGAVLAEIMKDIDDFWISHQQYQEDPHRALSRCGLL